MNRPLPRITIVTPSFNQGAFIEDTMRSVLEQDYPDLEYIVVDGDSTDGSVEIIRCHEDRLAWWISEKDHGQADAINKGFRRATGDIIAWLNSDDTYCPGALRRVADFFLQNPNIDVVVGDLLIIDASSKVLTTKKAIPITWRQNLYSGCAIPQPATFFNRRAYELVGDLDPSLHFLMDYEYFLRMHARGAKIGFIPHPLARFRLHGQSKTVSEYQRNFWKDFSRVQDLYLRVPLNGEMREYYRHMMKWATRIQMYLSRFIKRGVVRPFGSRRARQQVSTKQ